LGGGQALLTKKVDALCAPARACALKIKFRPKKKTHKVLKLQLQARTTVGGTFALHQDPACGHRLIVAKGEIQHIGTDEQGAAAKLHVTTCLGL
jgi:hypothetical protein